MSRIRADDIDLSKPKRKFGIDPYIVFDKNLNEIRMEIPLDKLMDPEENAKIREQHK
ncbi:hypothetical protein LCGC14_0933220 [marine sediment metagenome]|uniref:Uncharacterized protein n=1 Tax=marine sediment metagenome TaxID=412755 RepID=A0A0F9P8D6_9ZZZZ